MSRKQASKQPAESKNQDRSKWQQLSFNLSVPTKREEIKQWKLRNRKQ